MAAPVDPGDFVVGVTGDADAVDARFLAIYRALDKAAVGLDPASVQDGIVTPALIETQPGWSTVAFSSGTWSPATLSYRKDSIGRVRVKDLIYTLSVADIATGTTIATLPAGYRPGVKSYFTCNKPSTGGTTAHSVISIATNGVVKVEGNILAFDNGGFSQRVVMPNIEFLAEN